MAEELVTMSSLPTVHEVLVALQSGHNSFPVQNRSAQLVGKIPANFLIVLIEQHAWYRTSFSNNATGGVPDPEAFIFDSSFPQGHDEAASASDISASNTRMIKQHSDHGHGSDYSRSRAGIARDPEEEHSLQ